MSERAVSAAKDRQPEEASRLAALQQYQILDTSPEPAFEHIADIAAQYYQTPIALISLEDDARQWFKARRGVDDTQTPREESFCSLTSENTGVLIVENALEHVQFGTYPSVMGAPNVRFYAGAPLISRAGHKLGTLCVMDTVPRKFGAADAVTLEKLAALVVDELELRLALTTLQHLALHDGLTGLPNRTNFKERLRQAKSRADSSETKLIVGLLDLNRFKTINDTLGHVAGDELLQQVGQRLRETVYEIDTVARMGGDEFALIFEGVDDARHAEHIAGRIVQVFAQPFQLSGREVEIRCSLGLTVYPDHSLHGETLLAQADIAMYSAKTSGRRFSLFRSDDEVRSLDDVTLESDLSHALERGELQLYFQPIVQADTVQARTVQAHTAQVGEQKLEMYEALLRWNHPTRGSVPPLAFIGLAETTGLIVAIGRWVLREACRFATVSGQMVTVNISAAELMQADFIENMTMLLEDCEVDAGRLVLEVTESILIDRARGAGILRELKGLGVMLALDDFGTGYSSLAYLTSLPFDILKLDQSFLRVMGTSNEQGARSGEVVRAIVALAHTLGLKVVAEGVETLEIAEFAVDAGCDLLQGYLFGRPAPASHALSGKFHTSS
jgi:diguanylate cyclase